MHALFNDKNRNRIVGALYRSRITCTQISMWFSKTENNQLIMSNNYGNLKNNFIIWVFQIDIMEALTQWGLNLDVLLFVH